MFTWGLETGILCGVLGGFIAREVYQRVGHRWLNLAAGIPAAVGLGIAAVPFLRIPDFRQREAILLAFATVALGALLRTIVPELWKGLERGAARAFHKAGNLLGRVVIWLVAIGIFLWALLRFDATPWGGAHLPAIIVFAGVAALGWSMLKKKKKKS